MHGNFKKNRNYLNLIKYYVTFTALILFLKYHSNKWKLAVSLAYLFVLISGEPKQLSGTHDPSLLWYIP